MIELPRLNIADIKIKPTDYEGTCYESAYHNAGWGEPTPSLGAPIANHENRAHESKSTSAPYGKV
jgi:hypothetical protein